MTSNLQLQASLTEEIKYVAMRYHKANSVLIELLSKVGQGIASPLDKLPDKANEAIFQVVERALLHVYDAAAKVQHYEDKLNQREFIGKISNVLENGVFKSRNQAAAALSGLLGGVGGFQTMLLELPVAIGLIFKEIQRVSAEYGRDPTSEETRKECLAIFASGTKLEADDYADSAFIAARLALRGSTVFELINKFAPQIIRIFGPKIVSPPVVGMAIGAGINYIYIGYFKEIAHVQFRIDKLSKQFGDASVHEEFKAQVEQLRKNTGIL